MFKKIIASFLILATTALFGMSLSQLNKASKAELMEINGIGEVKASAIIKERRKGAFKSFSDLERVDGVGAQIAANAKNDIKSGDKVKKVKKTTKKKVSTKKDAIKKSTKEKAEKKAKKTKSKSKSDIKKTKKRKLKSIDEKKKELKTRAKKTKSKKTKAKKEKKTKSKN